MEENNATDFTFMIGKNVLLFVWVNNEIFINWKTNRFFCEQIIYSDFFWRVYKQYFLSRFLITFFISLFDVCL